MQRTNDYLKCYVCEAPAVAVFPMSEFNIQGKPYCSKHIERARLEVLQMIDEL